MNSRIERRLLLTTAIAAVTALAGISNAMAAPLNLPRAPLFLNAAVEPNVVTTLDDSGSMESAFMPDTVDDNCAYRHPKFYYSGFNRVYYNPSVRYTPPLNPDGSPFPDSSFNAAWLDGYEGQPTSRVTTAAGSAIANLATQYLPNITFDARVANAVGTRIGHGGTPLTGFVNCNNPGGGVVNTGQEFLPAADVAMVLGDIAGSNLNIFGSAALGQIAGSGIGVTGGTSAGQINSGEVLTIDFVSKGFLPAGVTNVVLDFNDTADTDASTIRIYGADMTTLLRTLTLADTNDQTLGDLNIGRITITGGAASDLILRRVRYSEELSAFLPFTTGAFVAENFAGGFTSSAFYFRFSGNPAIAAEVNDATRYAAVNLATEPAAEQTNFANWYSFYRTRLLLSRSALSRVFGVQDAGLRVGWQNLDPNNEDANAPRGPGLRFRIGTDQFLRFAGAGRNSFFQWLYRSPATGVTPNRAAMLRVVRAFASGTPATLNLTNPYYEPAPLNRELTCRQNFHIHVTDGFTNETANPAIPATVTARPNTSRTLPDGKSFSTTDPASTIIWNALAPPANGCGAGVTCTPSLADISFAYWATDLRPDLTNNVPVYLPDRTRGITTPATGPLVGAAIDDPEIYWNPVNDPASWQHVVNFTVGLGVAGNRSFPADYVGLRRGALDTPQIQWPGLTNNAPPGIDDLWRAGVVSRGGYFSAGDPDELVDSLSATLNSVLERRGTASAATVTSGIIQSSTLAFRTGFDSGDWSGEVNAFEVDEQGILIQPPVWEADTVLDSTGPDTRQILTSSLVTGTGIPFRWNSLPTAYQNALNDDPATGLVDNDGFGSDRVDYIRGIRSREANNVSAGDTGSSFRIRTSVLGAVVNSGAVVVAAPSAGYTDIWPTGAPENSVPYSEFRSTYKLRSRVIYVGANDGMMHAFDSGRSVDSGGNPVNDPGTGRELFAYVPREIASSLSRLTNANFEFTPYVDNTPVVRDVFMNGAWRTLLVGTLRRGGQGVFALDVTDPTQITEATAGATVLWEFSDDVPAVTGADVKRLGYTFGRPNVSRLANGKWMIVVPGGYNNDEIDAKTGNGTASMFFLDAADGSLLREINIPSARGLATPTMGDYDDDFIDEFAVAGDLDGNLWRFNLTDTDPSQWSVEKMFQPAVLGNQPITAAPRLFPDPGTGGLIAVFGTGKYLEPVDRGVSGVPTQSLYGVREYGPGSLKYPVVRTNLVQQVLTKTTNITTGVSTFAVTANGINPNNPDSILLNRDGWYFDFLDPGERDVTSAGALFSIGLAVVSTIIPNGDDPCLPGLRGNVYLVDGATGTSGQAFATDANSDGVPDSNLNQIGISVAETVAEGSPAVLAAAGGGIGRLVDFPNITVPQTVWRRRSWREITPED